MYHETRTRRKIQIREAAKKPTAPLKELQGEHLAVTGHSVHVTTTSCILYKGNMAQLLHQKNPKRIPCKSSQNVFQSDENKIDLYGPNTKRFVRHKNKTASDPKNTIPMVKHETWWWQHRTIGLLLFTCNRGSCQDRGIHSEFHIQIYSSIKPACLCSTPEENVNKDDDQRLEMAWSEPRSCKSYSEPVEWPEEGCRQKIHLQFHGCGTFSQGRVE